MQLRARIRNLKAFEDAKRLAGAGSEPEIILAFLREQKCDIADCIYYIESIFQKDFATAKGIVTHSRTWSDRYEFDTKLREAARGALRELAGSHTPDLPHIEFEEENE